MDIVRLDTLDQTQIALAGGKAARLGELTRIEGVVVPDGVCLTTEVYRRIVRQPEVAVRLERLSAVPAHDEELVAERAGQLRAAIEAVELPGELVEAVSAALTELDLDAASGVPAVAVRSSATAEDLAAGSAAGQYDSFLDVVGAEAVLDRVRRCWASLFSARAVAYRLRHAVAPDEVAMAVVIQTMVRARAAGVMFTADPVSGDRRNLRVEAVAGLGENLVAGRADPDRFTVVADEIVEHSVAGARDVPVLEESDVTGLARWGRRVEAHFGSPQDIEWAVASDGTGIRLLQSRPITTLFPVPERDDADRHVYLSVGHQQMMTDAMRPLGISVWSIPAAATMHTAGGRMFVDVTRQLASPAGRAGLLALIGRSDPLSADALTTLCDDDYIALSGGPDAPASRSRPAVLPADLDPALIRATIERNEEAVEKLRHRLRPLRGPELITAVLADFTEMKQVLFDPQSFQMIMAGIEASWWLNDHLAEWLGEANAADVLTRSAPGNVTSEMGLALIDVADVVRAFPAVVSFLRSRPGEDFLDRLDDLDGGPQARVAIDGFLDRYGMRCVGEIDITRPRWSERPTSILPMLLSNVDDLEPGASARRVARGRQEAEQFAADVLNRLRRQPEGESRAEQTEKMIMQLRTFIGYREYPKYAKITREFVYKQALLAEAARQVDSGVLRSVDDVFYLSVPEFAEVVSTRRLDHQLIRRRRQAFAVFETLRPPRVLTSDGQMLNGHYRRDDQPDGALPGLAVSVGVVEGRARVVLDPATADVGPGDILVTPHTDPSWSPLFVSVAGLVTEVGGLMTHGAVIAREFGLPAVVGVVRATELIVDGQRIRVDGTRGWVEILDSGDAVRDPGSAPAAT